MFGSLFDLANQGLLDFDYLMVVKGTRRLKKPIVSVSFVWSGHEVASLAGQGSLYIMTKSRLLENPFSILPTDEMEVMSSYNTFFTFFIKHRKKASQTHTLGQSHGMFYFLNPKSTKLQKTCGKPLNLE